MRSRLQWAGHVERMADDRLPKRAAELREQGSRRRGRSRLRWEDCVKRDVRKTGEEEDWKKKTRDRGGKRGNICVDTIFMIIIMHSFPDIEENLFFDNGGTHLHTHNLHYYTTTF